MWEDHILLELYLKKLPLQNARNVQLKLWFPSSGQVLEHSMQFLQGVWDYQIQFACQQNREERRCGMLYLFIGKDRVICDEAAMGLLEEMPERKIQGEERSRENMEEENEGRDGKSMEEMDREKNMESMEERNEGRDRANNAKRNEEKDRENMAKRNEGRERENMEEWNEGRPGDMVEKSDGGRNREIVGERDEEIKDVNAGRKDMYAASRQRTVRLPDPSGRSEKYYLAKPEQLGQFGSGFAGFADNSFLLHGYYNYRHIIVGPVSRNASDPMRIGVPGNYYQREGIVAEMFGFLEFEAAKGEEGTGAFGYYYTPRMPVHWK